MADPKHSSERRIEIGQVRRAKTRARIIAAAFELFGSQDGLQVRVEEVSQRAGITRATFYDHFTGMAELREAVTYEVTHDFLTAVNNAVSMLEDPRERAAAAIRFYLHKTREDPRWGWSMVNLSANGIIFGAETYEQAELTAIDGIKAGLLRPVSSAIARDCILGTSLAAMGSMLRGLVLPDYPEQIVEIILVSLGVDQVLAAHIAGRPLPRLCVTPSPAD